MHTTLPARAHADSPAAGRTPRVAVAGATGYAGQELVRLLARHPAARLTAAMASGQTAAARPLPALARVWRGELTPFDPAALAGADIVFLALPDAAAAGLAPALVAAGTRVVDLSGAFRLRDAAARARWYPETDAVPERLAFHFP